MATWYTLGMTMQRTKSLAAPEIKTTVFAYNRNLVLFQEKMWLANCVSQRSSLDSYVLASSTGGAHIYLNHLPLASGEKCRKYHLGEFSHGSALEVCASWPLIFSCLKLSQMVPSSSRGNLGSGAQINEARKRNQVPASVLVPDTMWQWWTVGWRVRDKWVCSENENTGSSPSHHSQKRTLSGLKTPVDMWRPRRKRKATSSWSSVGQGFFF